MRGGPNYQLIHFVMLFLLFSFCGCEQKGIGTATILARVFVTSDSERVKGEVPVSIQLGSKAPLSHLRVPVNGHSEVLSETTVYTEDSLFRHNRFFPLRDISVRITGHCCEDQSIHISQSTFVMKPKPLLTLNCIIRCGKPIQD